MEPERKIEKLLRAFAKKRRAEAVDPLKLHPVNRRILQDEAGRRAPATGAGSEGNWLLLLFALFRRRLVFALCIVAAAFLGASMVLPALSKAKKRAQTVNAVNNLKQIVQAVNVFFSESNRLPASLDEIKGQLASDKVLIDPQSGKPFVYVGSLSNSVVAYSPANKDGSVSVAFWDGHVDTRNAGDFSELTNQKSTELALADESARARPVNTPTSEPVAAAAPPPVLQTADDFEKAKLNGSVSQNFAQASATANQQNLFRNDSVSGQTVSVLQSFQVQQNGNAISVVDRDGSVYHGSLQPTNATVSNEPAPSKTFAARIAPGSPPQSQTKVAQAAANEQQAIQNYFFRVAGTNRTLKQNVVFTGNVLANNGVPQPVQTKNFSGTIGGIGGGGGGAGGSQFQQAAANQSQQSLLLNSRIVGTAVIASTNQIEINAVPVTQ